MKVYQMTLIATRQRHKDGRPDESYLSELDFSIPSEYLDDEDGHFYVDENRFVEDESAAKEKVLTVYSGYDQDGCDYSRYHVLESLIPGKKYNLIFVKNLGYTGTWFVLEPTQ